MAEQLAQATMVVYLHGFQSSPLSEKATVTHHYLLEHFPQVAFLSPQLPSTPQATAEMLQNLMDSLKGESMALIGSSLGGFWADWLGVQYALPRALINPVVNPVGLMSDFLGEHQNPYTEQTFQLTDSEIQIFESLEKQRSEGGNQTRFVFLESGDEVLDYRKAKGVYSDSPLYIEEGGNHRFQNYEKWLPYLLKLLNLRA